MLLEELIHRAASETEEQVNHARKRLNPSIREALRRETALRMRREPDQENRSFEAGTVPVSVVPGLPTVLQNRQPDPQYAIAATLAPYRRTLEQH